MRATVASTLRAWPLCVALTLGGCGPDRVPPSPRTDGGLDLASVDPSDGLPDLGANSHPWADLGAVGQRQDGGAPLPGTLAGVQQVLVGQDVRDVSTDQGGGVWAVTTTKVLYLPAGATTFYSYDQSNGLARGWTTYTDTYFSPGTWPVTFSAVAGAHSGEAIVGNIGAIADRIEVDPTSGAMVRLDNMQVTPANTSAAEYPEHLQRVIAVWKVIADLDGTYQGTAYLGGFHGFYAFHGLNGDCGCLAFEEHQHYITPDAIGGGDVRGLAFTADGDVWAGDREFVQLLPQRGRGPFTGLFDYDITIGIDVFPGVKDEVTGVAVDGSGGLYVASDGNGLAYLSPATYAPTYFAVANGHLRGVEVDSIGDVWMGSESSGLFRYRPSTNQLVSYDTSDGLPSNAVRAIYLDRYSSERRLFVATAAGVIRYTGP